MSYITIGKFRTTGVHDVRIRRSMHSFVDTATVVLPSIARIKNKKGQLNPGVVTTGNQFADGDKVTIKLGYDNANTTEFEGFVTRRDLNMPLEISCEGYSYQLRRNKVSGYWKEITVKDLLAKAVEGTDITINCNTDIVLTNVKAINAPGIELLNFILKQTEGAISLFFISAKVLWAGLVYSDIGSGKDVAGIGEAKYRLGWNCPRENDLKQRTLSDNPVVVNYLKRTPEGTIFSGTSTETAKLARQYKKVLNHLKETFVKQLADEKQDRLNYLGYEGKLTGFLKPYCIPGYKVYITDTRYPDLTGYYLAESVEIRFGVKGARRIIEIGPQIGWKNG